MAKGGKFRDAINQGRHADDTDELCQKKTVMEEAAERRAPAAVHREPSGGNNESHHEFVHKGSSGLNGHASRESL